LDLLLVLDLSSIDRRLSKLYKEAIAMNLQSGILFIILSCISVNIIAGDTRQIIFVLDLVRHGARTSFESLPTAPYDWHGKGQLTAKGMRQEYNLGVQLRKRYIYDLHLLPNHYSSDTMYVSSTNYDRTLMSAQALLIGLYPLGTGPYIPHTNIPALPSAFQPIPIHPMPARLQGVPGLRTNSQLFKSLVKKYVYTSPDWRAKNAMLQNQFKHWSDVIGIPINDLSQLIFISDAISIYQLNAVPLPKGLSSADAKQIVNAGNWALAREFSPSVIGDVIGHDLTALIVETLLKASKDQIKFKYMLFMGHDASILSVMSALHAPLTDVPPVASDLNFTLYRINSKQHVVTLKLNDKPIYIPICKSYTCPLEKLIILLKSSIHYMDIT
jgi:lysosomal acid phosphatase